MGFFDKVFAPTTSDVVKFKNEQHAFMFILFSCAYADGELDDLESGYIAHLIVPKKFLSNFSFDNFIPEFTRLKERFGTLQCMKEASKILSEENTKGVFIASLDLVFANSLLDQKEEEFIEELANILELDEDFVMNVAEIIRLKYS